MVAPASAAPQNAGARCTRAGLGTLKSLGLLQAPAQQKIDYSTLANPTTGPIFAALPSASYLSLGQVVKPHHTPIPSCSQGAAEVLLPRVAGHSSLAVD